MPHNTKISTHTPEYGDHKALTLELPQIGDIQPHKAKLNCPSPTTRSIPQFILPVPQNLIDLYRLGNNTTSDSAHLATQTTTALLASGTTTIDQVDSAANQRYDTPPHLSCHSYQDMANAPNKTKNTNSRTAQATNLPSGTKTNRKTSKAQKQM